MSAPILAILNSYSPTTGANIAQVVLRSDGSVQLYGDEATCRFTFGRLVGAPLPPQEPPQQSPRDIPVPRRTPGRPRKVR